MRILPLLAVLSGVTVLVIGSTGHYKSERLRVVGVTMISFSLFWFVWGNCMDFCLNYGEPDRDDSQRGGSTATHETKV